MQGSSMHGISGSTVCMDNSFVALPKQRPLVSQVPRGTADPGQPGKAMGKSFVVVYKSESALDGSGANSTIPEGGPNSSLPTHNFGFHSTITILKRAFEMATTQTQCLEKILLPREKKKRKNEGDKNRLQNLKQAAKVGALPSEFNAMDADASVFYFGDDEDYESE